MERKSILTFRGCAFLSLFLSACFIPTANAQPTVISITGGSCSGSTLTLTSTATPAHIVWKRYDSVTNTIQSTWQATGTTVAGAVTPGTDNQHLSKPEAVCTDNNGHVYVSDLKNARVQMWALNADSGITVAGGNGTGAGANQLDNPNGICTDKNDNIYIADRNNNRIQMWAPGDTVGITVAGGNGYGNAANQLASPTDIAIDTAGNIYIADRDNNRIQMWAPGDTAGITIAGSITGVAGSDSTSLNQPTNICLDSVGNLYILDSANHRIMRWQKNAAYGTIVAGSNYTNTTTQYMFSGLYADGAGDVYTADILHQCIMQMGNTDSAVVIAGTYNVSDTTAQTLYNPNDVFVDESGNLYVADAGNNRIQKFANDIAMDYATPTSGVYSAIVVTYNGDTAISNTDTLINIWTGTNSSDWYDAANWCSGHVPNALDNVSIFVTDTALYMPVIDSGNITINNLSITDSSSLSINNNAILHVTGSLLVNGTIKGTGYIALNGNTTQTITTNKGIIDNLKLDNIAGVIIDSTDTLCIAGNYQPTNGLLTINGGFILLSDSTHTATVGKGPDSVKYISGNVTVQQYIHGGRRAFRFFSHPFDSSISLSQLQSGLDITGLNGAANGFTSTQTNNPSAFWYDPTTGNGSEEDDSTGWKAFTNVDGADTNAWRPYEGIRVMVRGLPGEGLQGQSYTPSATTITMHGHLNQGDTTIALTPNNNVGYNFIGNPYAAPVDLSLLSRDSSVGLYFWVWDPNQQTQGAYIALPFSDSYILPAYSAFFATVSADTANTIKFTEAAKVTDSTLPLLFRKTSGIGNLIVLHIYNKDKSRSWDRLMLAFNQTSMTMKDPQDAGKLTNPDLNFYTFSTDNNKLSIDTRPYLEQQTIKLGLTTDVQQEYLLQVDEYSIPAGVELTLHDKYLNQYHSLQDGTTYPFTVNADAASQGDNRFEIITKGLPSGITAGNELHVNISPNPATDVAHVQFEANLSGYTTVLVSNILGQRVFMKYMGQQQNNSIDIPVKQLAAGVYLVTVQCGDQKQTARLVKQ